MPLRFVSFTGTQKIPPNFNRSKIGLKFCLCYHKAGKTALKEQYFPHQAHCIKARQGCGFCTCSFPRNRKTGHFPAFPFTSFPDGQWLRWTLSPQPPFISQAALLPSHGAAAQSSGSSPGEKSSIYICQVKLKLSLWVILWHKLASAILNPIN